MHLVVIFHNIGGYHAARLRAAQRTFERYNWNMTAVQVYAQTGEHPWGDLEKEITFPVRSLLTKTNGAAGDQRSAAQAARLIAKTLDELKPSVVAIPGWGFPESRAALAWCKRNGAISILMSESKYDDERRVWWKEWIKAKLYVSKFEAALVGGEAHRKYLIGMEFPSARIFSGYDTVDNQFFARTAAAAREDKQQTYARQPRIPRERPFFIAATRLIERKNVARLLDAYASYRREVGSDAAWDLVVCGSGVEENALRRLLSELEIENYVHLPGFVAYQDMGDWYGTAEAFIHPAWQEQWGLVVNEACAAGLPILCSRTVGAAAELVRDGINGLLFDPHDADEVARALRSIHQMSAAERERMGRASENIVADFGPEKFGEGLLQGVYAAAFTNPRWLTLNLVEN